MAEIIRPLSIYCVKTNLNIQLSLFSANNNTFGPVICFFIYMGMMLIYQKCVHTTVKKDYVL